MYWIENIDHCEMSRVIQYRFVFQESGHSDWLGNCLKVFVIYDPWIMNLIFCLIVAMATNVPSNTAMATLLMPILAYVVSTKLF